MTETYMVPDLPAEDYHAGPQCSAGFLKKMKQSPYHAHYSRLHKSTPTPAMVFGTAWHAAFFERDKYLTDYAVLPEGLDKRTKEGKALWADLTAGGRTPISAADALVIDAMCQEAGRHPMAALLMTPALGGLSEPSIFSRDPETGVVVRVRPDRLIPPCEMFPNGLILDGKTTTDASPQGFGKQAWNLDYYIQAALYPQVVQRLFKTPEPPEFWWLAIEKDAPYGCAVYQAGSDLIEYGSREVGQLLAIYAQCERDGVWPGYSMEVAPLSLPGWAAKAMNSNDDEITAIEYV